MTSLRPAVFLDRDGTIIRDRNYIAKPEQVELFPNAAASIARLNAAGWPVIVVTNQSGIARGYFTEADYLRVRERLDQLLAAEGARIDTTYMCPHHPEFTGPCPCRKPGTLLFREAAATHGLQESASWYIGDKLRDILPARELGGQGVLIPSHDTPAADLDEARATFIVARSLTHVVDRILAPAA